MIVTCHSCRKNFEVQKSGVFLCPHCGVQNICGGSSQSVNNPINAYLWEDTWKQNFVTAIITTIKQMLFQPTFFFKSLASRKGFQFTPVVFFVLATQGLGVLVSGLTNIGFSLLTPLLKSLYGSPTAVVELLPGFISIPLMVLFILLIFPVFAIIGLFITAAVTHLFVHLFIKNHQPFEETLKLVGYCLGVNIVMVIPIVGGVIASIGQIVLLIIGVREVHQTTTTQASIAVLFPYLICCGFIVSLMAIIMSFIFSNIVSL